MRGWPVALLLMAVASASSGQSADQMQRVLSSEATKLAAWASDKQVVDAVRAQNAHSLPADELKRLDAEWAGGQAEAAVKRVTMNACAERLRKLAQQDARYGEVLVMDRQGGLVCATQRTTDYWQGDEAKWLRAFNDGKGAVFVDRPRMDQSANARLAQISLPIADAGQTIGVITVGINVDNLLAKETP